MSPASLVEALLAQGFHAEHVYDVGLQGVDDQIIFAYAQMHNMIVITGDLDFAHIKHFAPPHSGIFVVRVPDTMPPAQRNNLILAALQRLAGQDVQDTLVIIEPGRVRMRY